MFDSLASSSGIFAVLLFCRIAPALRMVPFFGGEPIPVPVWLALSGGLTLVLLPSVAVGEVPDGWVRFAAQALKEVGIGFFIGVMCRLAFSALESAGRLARSAMLRAPFSPSEDAVARLYTWVGIVALLLMGGHHTLIRGFSVTLRCVPPQGFPGAGGSGGADAVLLLFSGAMAAAVLIAAPLYAAGLISDLLVTAASRALSEGFSTAADAARAWAVQLVVIFSFAYAVERALQFIIAGMDKLLVCPPI